MSLTESCVAAVVVSTVMAIALPSLNRARQSYMLRSAAHDVAGQDALRTDFRDFAEPRLPAGRHLRSLLCDRV